MKNTFKSALFLSLFSSLALISCADSQADKIADAQTCLDKARTSAQAEVCFKKVDGVNTASADSIRCSAKFIGEGFASSSRIVDVFSNLESGGVMALMNLLTFTSQGSITNDTTNANNTFEYCYDSGSKGATLLMSFSNITMSFYNYFSANNAGGCPATPSTSGSILVYPFSTCFSDVGSLTAIAEIGNANTVDNAARQVQSSVGTTIVATHLLSCSSGSQANKELCKYLGDAITNAGGASNTRQVAIEFITILATP